VVAVVVIVYTVRDGGNSNVIKVGFIGPLTGDVSDLGQPEQRITELAVDEINASGGINGKQLEVIYEDGKCDGADGATAAQKLISVDGVQAILGGSCSGEALAAVPIGTAAKVVMLSAVASSPKLTGISPYFFRDYPSDSTQGKVLADAAYNMKHWKSVAIIEEQADYSVGVDTVFTQEFGTFGGKATTQSFPTGSTDFRSILTTLRAQKPDALFIDSLGSDSGSMILQQIENLGWNVPLITNDTVAGDLSKLTAYTARLEGTLTAEFGVDATNPKYQHLLQAYTAKYGSAFAYASYGQTEYDAVYLLRDGLLAVGSNGQALAAWSRTISNWQGASGLITINADGDRTSGHRLEVIHNGQAVPVQQ
jgi:branched-chain amino acid transport system substrate-binding protein